MLIKGGRTDRNRFAVNFDLMAMKPPMTEEEQPSVQEKWGRRQQHRETMSATIGDVVRFQQERRNGN